MEQDFIMRDDFATVAQACEKVNAFAVELRANKMFSSVTTGTDLRDYKSGWKFEKYVEAQLDPNLGTVAVWWLDLSKENGRWKIAGNTSISYGNYDEDVAIEIVEIDKLDVGISRVIQALFDSYKPEHVFRQTIEKLLSR